MGDVYCQMDAELNVQQQHKEAAQLARKQLFFSSYFHVECRRERERRKKKGTTASQAFIPCCMACCYGNMTLHIFFSAAVFDQFLLSIFFCSLPLCHPFIVPECLTSVAD